MGKHENDTNTPSGQLAKAVRRLDDLHNWEGVPRKRMRQDLAPVSDLLEALDNPQGRFRSVHVAGTKGKGSVAGMVAEGLRSAGGRVGVYASPHVERINERLCINGIQADDGDLAEWLGRALDALEDCRVRGNDAVGATWFDTLTAAAFLGFAESGCEWVVAECGLGGRLDSTNVLLPELCILTGVELEHTEILGDTRAAIATEKAGILKAGVPLVTSLLERDEAGAPVARRAAELAVAVSRPAAEDWEPAGVARRNLLLAELALEVLAAMGALPAGQRPSSEDLASGARLPGRLELFRPAGPAVVLDGAHVPGSVSAVLTELGDRQGLSGRPQAVLALALDKDQEGILKALAGRVDSVICTSMGAPAFREPAALCAAAEEAGLAAETAANPLEALALAQQRAASCGGWVLAIGSLYLAGALRPHLRQLEATAPCSPSSPISCSRTPS
ncbi:MAG TPA: bifunctional folylpolyglutamate synthase/dihydrofolate synthase [Planctomycetota bacterium]|jgi:dihydrofolate synthase/folylpolyglutamate synthase|nr:bifunctional folylpolyglutamate synthase/dihydrofolate synthase [Planctomycetota bacterium]